MRSSRRTIVCDTNVVISALVFPGSKPDKIIKEIVNERLVNFTSEEILTEIRRILSKKFKFSAAETNRFVNFYKEISQLIVPTQNLSRVRGDESDNRILECAFAGGARFVITGDKKHLLPIREFQGIKIVTPDQFLNLLT